MRPFIWGGLLLLVVVGAVVTPVMHVDRSGPVVAARAGRHESTVVVTNGNRTIVTARAPRTPRPPRGEDLQTVVRTWEVTGEYSDKESEAYESAVDKARAVLTHDLGLAAVPTPDLVREFVTCPKTETKPNVVGTDPAFRTTLTLDLTRGQMLRLAESDRAYRVTERMEATARALAILVAALAAVSGYIRLDEWTKGYYTGWLRIVTIAAVAVATMVIGRV